MASKITFLIIVVLAMAAAALALAFHLMVGDYGGRNPVLNYAEGAGTTKFYVDKKLCSWFKMKRLLVRTLYTIEGIMHLVIFVFIREIIVGWEGTGSWFAGSLAILCFNFCIFYWEWYIDRFDFYVTYFIKVL